MTKVTIISGFLGAGKTTLIKKLLKEAFKGEKVVLLENEYGEVGIDGGFMKDSGIEVTELNSGCICCTLAGDFTKAIGEIVERFSPDRLIIEPSGVGKLSDIRRVVEKEAEKGQIELTGSVTVVDAAKCKMYLKNFGEFFTDQVKCAETVIFSRTQLISEEKLTAAFELVRDLNETCAIVSTPWDEIDGQVIVDTYEHPASLIDVNEVCPESEHHHHHHHHHHDDEDECGEEHHHHHDEDDDDEDEHEHHHHHHDDDDDDEDEHEHHHHHHDDDDDDDDDEHEHHHHHHDDDDDDDDEDEHEHHHHEEDDGETRVIHQHHHHHHHHHHHEGELDADDVFENFGVETSHKFTEEGLRAALEKLSDVDTYGFVLRSKGIIPAEDGRWLHYDFVPEEFEIRYGSADYTGRLCVIGSKLNEHEIMELFGI